MFNSCIDASVFVIIMNNDKQKYINTIMHTYRGIATWGQGIGTDIPHPQTCSAQIALILYYILVLEYETDE